MHINGGYATLLKLVGWVGGGGLLISVLVLTYAIIYCPEDLFPRNMNINESDNHE